MSTKPLDNCSPIFTKRPKADDEAWGRYRIVMWKDGDTKVCLSYSLLTWNTERMASFVVNAKALGAEWPTVTSAIGTDADVKPTWDGKEDLASVKEVLENWKSDLAKGAGAGAGSGPGDGSGADDGSDSTGQVLVHGVHPALALRLEVCVEKSKTETIRILAKLAAMNTCIIDNTATGTAEGYGVGVGMGVDDLSDVDVASLSESDEDGGEEGEVGEEEEGLGEEEGEVEEEAQGYGSYMDDYGADDYGADMDSMDMEAQGYVNPLAATFATPAADISMLQPSAVAFL